jgi:hypothetical protein
MRRALENRMKDGGDRHEDDQDEAISQDVRGRVRNRERPAKFGPSKKVVT